MPVTAAAPCPRARRRSPLRRLGRALLGLTALGALLGTATPAIPHPAEATHAPRNVPTPTETTSVLTVRTGGDRTGDKSVAPLAGVRLELLDAGSGDPVGAAWSTCTSDADGDCTLVVPDTQSGGAQHGRKFEVRQAGVPSGWYTNPTLHSGSGSGARSAAKPYRFTTPAMAAGKTYRSTEDFVVSDSPSSRNPQASGGIWQQSRNNPPLPSRCGLDVALVLDVSESVGSRLPQLKRGADRATDGLTGTASRMSVFSFSGTSPSTGNSNHPELQPVSTRAGADAFKERYADYRLGSGTDRSRGLYQVAQAEEQYDLVVVLTDGNPARPSNDAPGNGSRTHLRDVENGIFSANALKAKGSRLLALGTGASGETGDNLRALSGPQPYDGGNVKTADHAQLSNYKAAGDALHQLALDQCANSLTVTKALVPARNTGEDISGAQPAGPGWNFTAETTAAGVGGLPDRQTTTEDATGSVVFSPTYPTGVDAAEVRVGETQQPGHTLVTQQGRNAVCVNKDTGAPVPVRNVGESGFTLDEPAGAAVHCTVYNRAAGADLTVDKSWRIDGTDYADGDQPDGFSAQLTLGGPGGADPSDQDWGEQRSGYEQGEKARLDERVDVPDGCRVVDRRVRKANDEPANAELPYKARLTAPHQTYRLTNTVACGAELTLVKKVQGGTGQPTDWVLHAAGPTTVTGESGSAAVTDVRVEPGTYRLSEEGGPEGYGAAEWSCRDADGETTPVDDGAVTLDRRTSTTCTVTNSARAEGGWTVEPRSDPPDGDTVEPGSVVTYTLTVRPADGVAGEVELSDDLSRVLDHARALPDSIRASAGTAELTGTALRWHIPDPDAEERLTYRVRVADDATDKRLANVVTPGREGSCTECGVELTTAPALGGGMLPRIGSGSGSNSGSDSGYPMLAAGGAALLLSAGAALTLRRKARKAEDNSGDAG